MESQTEDTPNHISEESPGKTRQQPDIEYAGFWIRVLAAILDTVLLLMVMIPLLLIFYGPGVFFATESLGLAYDAINYGLPVLAVIVFWEYRSATPGKIMMGIYIVDAVTLQQPPFGCLVLRYLGYYVSILPLLLGLIWVGIDKRKQGFHDKIARTLVIKVKRNKKADAEFQKTGNDKVQNISEST